MMDVTQNGQNETRNTDLFQYHFWKKFSYVTLIEFSGFLESFS